MVTVNTAALVAVAKATAPSMGKHDARAYLNGAHLVAADGKLRVETADGHRVAIVTLETELADNFDVIVDRDDWLAISRLKPLKGATIDSVTITLHGSAAVASQSGGLTFPLRRVDGKFPDVARATPDGEPSATAIGLNSGYMADAFKAAAAVCHGRLQGAEFKIVDANSPVRIKPSPLIAGVTAALFAVMPMRL